MKVMSPNMQTPTPTKECSNCKQVKPLEDFHKRAASRDGHRARCKECIKHADRELFRRRAEEHAQSPTTTTTRVCRECGEEKSLRDDFYKNHRSPEGFVSICKECMRDRHLRDKYDISSDRFDEMLAEQGGGCGICGATEPGGNGNTFHVDHDHATGKVRGLLCSKCNPGLGCFDDDPDLLQNAIEYLNRHKELREAA